MAVLLAAGRCAKHCLVVMIRMNHRLVAQWRFWLYCLQAAKYFSLPQVKSLLWICHLGGSKGNGNMWPNALDSWFAIQSALFWCMYCAKHTAHQTEHEVYEGIARANCSWITQWNSGKTSSILNGNSILLIYRKTSDSRTVCFPSYMQLQIIQNIYCANLLLLAWYVASDWTIENLNAPHFYWLWWQ